MFLAEFGIVLLIFLVTLAFTFYVWIFPYRKALIKTRRYKFFKLRDDLITLAAEKVIDEDDPTFQFLYRSINDIIPAAKPLNLQETLVVLKMSPLVEKEELALVEKSLLHKDVRVRIITADFLSAIINVILIRSFFVRLAIWGLTGYYFTSMIRKHLARVFSTQNEIYEWYNYLGDASKELKLGGG